MKQIAAALLALSSVSVFAQDSTPAAAGGSFGITKASVTTLVVAGALPLVALVAITAAAESGDDSPTAPSVTSTRTR